MRKRRTLENPLISQALLRKWRQEHERIVRQIEELGLRRDRLMAMIENGATFASVKKPPRPRAARKLAPKAKPEKPATHGVRRARGDTWIETIKEIVTTAGRPVAYSEAKAAIAKTALGPRLERSDKGFYGAIARLHRTKEVVRHKGHLFSAEVFRKFEADLKAGLIADVKMEHPSHHSPMGEAIKMMMRTRPNGAKSGNIIWELNKNPEFAEQIGKNKTHPYNVLKRLVDQSVLMKRGKRYYYVAKDKAPSDDGSEGASEPDGASTPSNERREVGSLFAGTSGSRPAQSGE